MPRTSPVHYLQPSAVSIVPNCNRSADDVAVAVARGTKIKVWSPGAGIDMAGDTYQEWELRGRNRRLADGTRPYTIYARIGKPRGGGGSSFTSPGTVRDPGYIVFAPKNGSEGEGWRDKYPYVAPAGLVTPDGAADPGDYWYVRMGYVTLPEEGAGGERLRTVVFDTGILGTDRFNTEWAQNPDRLRIPSRVEKVDRGEWAATRPAVPQPAVTYNGPSGTYAPDGTLSDAALAEEVAVGNLTERDAAAARVLRTWGGAYVRGAEIHEPYHLEAMTRAGWVAQRLSEAWAGYTDLELYETLLQWNFTLETSRAWKGGILWECLADCTQQEPAVGCTDWTPVTAAAADYRMAFCDATGYPYTEVIPCRPGYVSLFVSPRVTFGDEDITQQADSWQWHKYVNASEDTAWSATHTSREVMITDADFPTAWGRQTEVVFECVATYGALDVEIAKKVGFR